MIQRGSEGREFITAGYRGPIPGPRLRSGEVAIRTPEWISLRRPALGPTNGPANMVCRGGGLQKPLQGRRKLVPPAVGLAADPARLPPAAHSAALRLRFASGLRAAGGAAVLDQAERGRPLAPRSPVGGRLSASLSLPTAGGTGARGRELGPLCVRGAGDADDEPSAVTWARDESRAAACRIGSSP